MEEGYGQTGQLIEYQEDFSRKIKRWYRGTTKFLQRKYRDVLNSKRRQRKLLKNVQFFHFLIILFLVAVFVYMLWFSNSESIYIVGMRFVSVEEDRADVHTKSKHVTCQQIQGLEKIEDMDVPSMMETAVVLMKQNELSCNCAPLYNVTYRYITIENDWSPIHAFNPVITAPVTTYGRVMVTENQELLIPGAGCRDVTRLNGLVLSYMDHNCIKQSKTFVKEVAWCIQSCIELLDGKTIYDIT